MEYKVHRRDIYKRDTPHKDIKWSVNLIQCLIKTNYKNEIRYFSYYLLHHENVTLFFFFFVDCQNLRKEPKRLLKQHLEGVQ